MTGPEKLKTWRRNMALSHRDLSSMLETLMLKDFSEGIPKGAKIHPSDISEAETSESPFKYKKVTNAVQKYFELPDNFFGDFVNLDPVALDTPGKRENYRDRLISLMDELIEANQEIQKLRDEKFALLKENLDLEKRILDLEKTLESKK